MAQTVPIAAAYFPDVNQLSFTPGPPFTSDEDATDFVFTLAMAQDSNGNPISGTVTWADPAVFFGTPAPSPLWPTTVTADGTVLTIEDDNWNTFSKSPLRFPFTLAVIYNGQTRTIDPTILNAEIPPGPGPGDDHGHEHGREIESERAARAV